MECVRGSSIEPRIGRQDHEVGAEPMSLPDRHTRLQAGEPCLRRESKDDGSIGGRRSNGQRPLPERGIHHFLEGGAEGGGIDIQHRSHGIPENVNRKR
jgi:hypothetical protein